MLKFYIRSCCSPKMACSSVLSGDSVEMSLLLAGRAKTYIFMSMLICLILTGYLIAANHHDYNIVSFPIKSMFNEYLVFTGSFQLMKILIHFNFKSNIL